MRIFVGVTDKDWFTLLASRVNIEEVNFWRPSPKIPFKALDPGELFLFKLHSPDNFIVGGGFFTKSFQRGIAAQPASGFIQHFEGPVVKRIELVLLAQLMQVEQPVEEGAVENPAVRVILHLPELENAAHHGIGTGDEVPCDQVTCDARIGAAGKLE